MPTAKKRPTQSAGRGKDQQMNAVIYARFSSDRQNEASIDAQVRACKEYAERRGLTVTAVYADEAISGKESKTAARQQYQHMLRDAQRGLFDVILIHKYDRVARSLAEHVRLNTRLQALHVELIAIAQDFGGSTPEAKIMRTLIWSMSEYYIDNLSAEVQKGHRETALKGLHNGGYPPFGYDVVNQHYQINELEAAFVRRIFTAAQEGTGFTAILEELHAAGITGKRGRPIQYTQLYEMLRNEKYTGVYLYTPKENTNRAQRRQKPDAIRIENAFPAIISKEQFSEVQHIMDSRKNTGRKANYLCSGLVYCACGAKMHVYTSTRKGHTYSRYVCSKHCGRRTVLVEDVDKAALQYLHELLSEPNQTLITSAMRKYQSEGDNRLSSFYAVLNARIKEKQGKYDALLKNLSAGALPAAVLADVGARMEDLKKEITALKDTTPPEDYTVDTIRQWLNSLKNSPDEKAVQLLISRIDVQELSSVKSNNSLNIHSTLSELLENMVAGVRTIEYKRQFPEILFTFSCG